MLKVKPHPDYPPEEGRYVRGNDFSPVAVAIILISRVMEKHKLRMLFFFRRHFLRTAIVL
jgi:hypothetical protein